MDTIISSDSHIFEPPDLWTKRIEAKFRDRAPHVVYGEGDKPDYWYCDGNRLMSMAGGANAGVRFEGQGKLRQACKVADVRPGSNEPAAKIRDMDADGIWGEVLYPTVPLRLWRIPDSELFSANCRAYNDWLAEFCRAYPQRLKGLAMVNVDDIQEGIRELQRAAKLGLAGVMITVGPPEGRSHDQQLYEPFWAAAQDARMPVHLHQTTNRAQIQTASRTMGNVPFASVLSSPAAMVTSSYWVQLTLANMVFAGVFDRHQRLRAVSAHFEAGWAPHLMHTLDFQYTQRGISADYPRFKNAALPSDFFGRNILLSIQEDAIAIRMRDSIGADALMWGSIYPHPDSTFPHSREILAELLEGVPEAEQRLIVRENAAKLYGFLI